MVTEQQATDLCSSLFSFDDEKVLGVIRFIDFPKQKLPIDIVSWFEPSLSQDLGENSLQVYAIHAENRKEYLRILEQGSDILRCVTDKFPKSIVKANLVEDRHTIVLIVLGWELSRSYCGLKAQNCITEALGHPPAEIRVTIPKPD